MSTHVVTVSDPEQANLSALVRVNIKRLAAGQPRGLRALAALCDMPYMKAWNQLNRGQGVLIDLMPALSRVSDDPLRIIADACGYTITPKAQFLRRKQGRGKPIRSHALDIHHAAAAVTIKIEEALADKSIDQRDRERIKTQLQGLRRRMAELEAHLDGKE